MHTFHLGHRHFSKLGRLPLLRQGISAFKKLLPKGRCLAPRPFERYVSRLPNPISRSRPPLRVRNTHDRPLPFGETGR